jgi:hypothetical protein
MGAVLLVCAALLCQGIGSRCGRCVPDLVVYIEAVVEATGIAPVQCSG